MKSVCVNVYLATVCSVCECVQYTQHTHTLSPICKHVIYSHVPTNAQSKQQLVLHADTKFNYKVNNLIENMKYVLYDANIEFNAEKRAHVKCTGPDVSQPTRQSGRQAERDLLWWCIER